MLINKTNTKMYHVLLSARSTNVWGHHPRASPFLLLHVWLVMDSGLGGWDAHWRANLQSRACPGASLFVSRTFCAISSLPSAQAVRLCPGGGERPTAGSPTARAHRPPQSWLACLSGLEGSGAAVPERPGTRWPRGPGSGGEGKPSKPRGQGDKEASVKACCSLRVWNS